MLKDTFNSDLYVDPNYKNFPLIALGFKDNKTYGYNCSISLQDRNSDWARDALPADATKVSTQGPFYLLVDGLGKLTQWGRNFALIHNIPETPEAVLATTVNYEDAIKFRAKHSESVKTTEPQSLTL